MNFANAYTQKDERGKNWATVNTEDSMTQQADAKDADINVIMAKYQVTGQMPQVLMKPLFGDFSDTPDYRKAVETIREAEEAFLQIPAKIRAQFGNDPGEFIKFATDPNNKEELTKMGLTKPPEEPTLEQQTLEAIKALQPKDDTHNGTGQK